ncbi:unnamed protein product, partial [Allacma fusca]
VNCEVSCQHFGYVRRKGKF